MMSRASLGSASSFGIFLSDSDSEEITFPARDQHRHQKMRVTRDHATITSPRPAGKPGASGRRQPTPAPEPAAAQRETRAAATRGSTPAVEPQLPAAAVGPAARKRKAGAASVSREATPALAAAAVAAAANQENLPSNLRRSARGRSGSAPPRGGSAPPPAKKARRPSKSPAPPAAAVQQQQQQPGSGRTRRGGSVGPPAEAAAAAPQQQAAPPAGKRRRIFGDAAAATAEGAAALAGHLQQGQGTQPAEQPAFEMTTRPSANSLSMSKMTSVGPQRSESMLNSIIKSPSPPLRPPRPPPAAAPGAAQQLQAAGACGDQPAVDQPLHPCPPQQQRGEEEGKQGTELPAAVLVAAVAAEGEAVAEHAEEAEVAAEGRGESPPPEAQRAQQAPQQQAAAAAAAGLSSPAPAVLREGRLSISPGTLPPVVARAAAAGAAGGGLERIPEEEGEGEGQQQMAAAAVAGDAMLPRRQSPRRHKPSSPSGSAGKPAGSVRFQLPTGPPTSVVHGGFPGSPHESQHTANRSTARQVGAGAAERDQGTPISRRVQQGLEGAGVAAEEGDPSWFDPLDADKVAEAKAVLGRAACTAGVPLCREREVRLVTGFLHKHLSERSGGSMYVSGLPGTGKSLTVHELVRQCHRAAPAVVAAAEPTAAKPTGRAAGRGTAAATASPAAEQAQQALPPALISINCMSLLDPRQVIGSILGCYHEACQRPYQGTGGKEEEEEGWDPLIKPAPQQLVPSSGEALKQLQQLVLSPPAGPASVAAGGKAGRARGAGGGGKKGKQGGRRAGGKAAAVAAAAGEGAGGGGGPRGMIVVVLDEMDGLLASHASGAPKAGKRKAPRQAAAEGSPLLDLLALAHLPRSRLVLIGIANDLNLVQKVMPDVLDAMGLQASAPAGVRPAHVVFPPYQACQLSRLLQQRLAGLPGPAFDPRAVEMCARKMGNGNGDMRLALEVCAAALAGLAKEAAEAASKAAAAAVGEAGGAGVGVPGAGPPRLVGMRHMAAALGRLTGGIGSSNAYVQAVRALPAQQQLIMCAVAKLLGEGLAGKGTPLPRAALAAARSPTSCSRSGKGTKAKAQFMSPAASGRSGSGSLGTAGGSGSALQLQQRRDVSMGRLFEVFTALSQQIGFADRWDPSLFYSVCDNLEFLLAISRNSNPSLRRVTLMCHEDDVVMGVADTPQIRHIVGA